MARRLVGWLLVVLGVLGSSVAGLSAAMAVTDEDHLPGVVGFAILASITLVCLGGAWLLLHRRGTRRRPALSWEPSPGEGWLPEQAWRELPDVMPRRPRLGPVPPVPAAGVPPDARLRRLWLLRAELAFDQAGGMRSGSYASWIVLLALALSPTLLLGAVLLTGDLTMQDRGLLVPLLAWLIAGTVLSAERASRNPRRHFALRRMQRELEASLAASPGPIPAGPAVRLGDPTPRYAPEEPPEHTGPYTAQRRGLR